MASPNASLFDDDVGQNVGSLNGRAIIKKFQEFEGFLSAKRREKLCILEIGCGLSEHSLRLRPERSGKWSFTSEEWGLKPLAASVVRINPEGPASDQSGYVEIQAGAAEALQLLSRELEKQGQEGLEEQEVQGRGGRRGKEDEEDEEDLRGKRGKEGSGSKRKASKRR